MRILIRTFQDAVIVPGKLLPPNIIATTEQKTWPVLQEAQREDEIGEYTPALIVGKDYIIGKSTYNLDPGYALQAGILKDNTIVPFLRKSRGQEREILKEFTPYKPHVKQEKVGPINEAWPIIRRIN